MQQNIQPLLEDHLRDLQSALLYVEHNNSKTNYVSLQAVASALRGYLESTMSAVLSETEQSTLQRIHQLCSGFLQDIQVKLENADGVPPMYIERRTRLIIGVLQQLLESRMKILMQVQTPEQFTHYVLPLAQQYSFDIIASSSEADFFRLYVQSPHSDSIPPEVLEEFTILVQQLLPGTCIIMQETQSKNLKHQLLQNVRCNDSALPPELSVEAQSIIHTLHTIVEAQGYTVDTYDFTEPVARIGVHKCALAIPDALSELRKNLTQFLVPEYCVELPDVYDTDEELYMNDDGEGEQWKNT